MDTITRRALTTTAFVAGAYAAAGATRFAGCANMIFATGSLSLPADHAALGCCWRGTWPGKKPRW